MLKPPLFGKPLAGASHAGSSPEVSVIHDFLSYAAIPFTVAGRPAPGAAVHPLTHQSQASGFAPDELTPSDAYPCTLKNSSAAEAFASAATLARYCRFLCVTAPPAPYCHMP